MQTYIKSSYINCDVEKLFEFHLDASNLKKITPPNIKVEFLTKDFIAKPSQILELKSTKYFINTFWKVKIEKIEYPNLLVDIALKSPFLFWEHKHIFIKQKNGCELRDIVTYKLPFGFLGKLFNFLIKKDLEEMFSFRHKVTKKILEKKD